MLIKRKFLVLCLGCNLVPRALFPGSRLFRLAGQTSHLLVRGEGWFDQPYLQPCVCGSITTHQAGFKLFENKCIQLGLLERSYISLIQILFCPKRILYLDLL